MVKARTDEEIVAMVRHGGGAAFTAMGYVMWYRRDYPGVVDDVFGLLADKEPVSFGCSPSHLAQAYLFHKGLIERSDVEDCRQTEDLLKYYEAAG